MTAYIAAAIEFAVCVCVCVCVCVREREREREIGVNECMYIHVHVRRCVQSCIYVMSVIGINTSHVIMWKLRTV